MNSSGKMMNKDDIQEVLDLIKEKSYNAEFAHRCQDELYEDFIEELAHGVIKDVPYHIKQLAKQVLEVYNIDFKRGYE